MSFAPDQLPNAQRTTSDLVDLTTVGAYSIVKEEAMQKSTVSKSAEEIRRMIVNQSASNITMHVDEVGLDSEQLEDELSPNEEMNGEEPPVDESIIQKVIQRSYSTAVVDQTAEINPVINRIDMMKEIINLLGVRYRFGGVDAVRGLDCSAFTGTIFSRAFGVRLPRSSNEQFGSGHKIKKNDLKIGDLVFFKTSRRRGPVSHVGIYVGENLFAHASTKYGVIISTIEEGYYNKTYVGARRILTSNYSDAKVR